ncbi:MAG: DMT family transporter [Chloroflexota bacterium]|jgi:transporter family-2 protein
MELSLRGSQALALLAAIGSGVLIGTQATFTNRIGELIGSMRAGLVINTAGGAVAVSILLMLVVSQGIGGWGLSNRVLIMALIAGALGVLIIAGVAFSLHGTGVAAGVASLVMGQMIIGAIVDTTGISGADPIPLSLQRVAGLAVMALAIYLLLPRAS